MDVIPARIANDILIAVMLLSVFIAMIVSSAKSGVVMTSPWTARQLNKHLKYEHSHANLPAFIYLVCVTAASSAFLAFILGANDARSIGIVALLITAPNAYTYWCLMIVRVRD